MLADLAVLDIAMPRKTGLAAAREIRQRRPQTRVLMLSMADSASLEVLRNGRRPLVIVP